MPNEVITTCMELRAFFIGYRVLTPVLVSPELLMGWSFYLINHDCVMDFKTHGECRMVDCTTIFPRFYWDIRQCVWFRCLPKEALIRDLALSSPQVFPVVIVRSYLCLLQSHHLLLSLLFIPLLRSIHLKPFMIFRGQVIHPSVLVILEQRMIIDDARNVPWWDWEECLLNARMLFSRAKYLWAPNKIE